MEADSSFPPLESAPDTELPPPEDQALLADPDVSHLTRLASVVEAVLFTSQKPVTVKELLLILKGAAAAFPDNAEAQAFTKVKEPALRAAVEQLQSAYVSTGRSFEVRETAAGWQLMSRPDFAVWLRQLFPENRSAKLSTPALETLAIIAYRQPITRADLEAVRGVSVDGVMQTLLDRALIKIAGRAEIPGRPLLYETTQHFMEHFGLKDLTELPNARELRQVPLPKAPVPESVPAASQVESPQPPADDSQKISASDDSQMDSSADAHSLSPDDNAPAEAANPPSVEESASEISPVNEALSSLP